MSKPSYYSSGPGFDAVPITPNDSTVLAPMKAFWIGTAGNLRLRTLAGNTRTVPVIAGLFPVGGDMVLSTSTTATDIFGIPL